MPENKLFNKNQFELQKIRQEKNEIKKYMREHATFDNIINDIKESIKSLPSLLLPEFKLIQNESNNEKVLVMILSDLHIGQISNLDLNKYDNKILIQRLHKYFQEVKSIAEFHSVKKIILCFLGDLIEGHDIFKSIHAYSDIDHIEQVIKISEVLSRLINELSSKFIIEINYVLGNHSRLSYQLKSTTNFEKLIFNYIKVRLEDNNNVSILPSNDIYSIVKIFNFNYLLFHGHVLRDKDHAPVRLKDIMNNAGHNIHEILIGHFHNSQSRELFANGGELIICGSLVGCNEYSFTKLQAGAKATQTCFVVEKDKGRTATYKVKLN